MYVYLRGRYAFVTQPKRDNKLIDPMSQQIHGSAVSQNMGSEIAD